MRIFLLFFLASRVDATHFAAGSLQFRKDENGVVRVTRTMGWRRGYAGWGDNPGCVDGDLNKLSGTIGSWPHGSHQNHYTPRGVTVVTEDGDEKLANSIDVKYTLLQIEDNESLTIYQHYCYGKTFDEALPAAVAGRSFTMTNGYQWEAATLTVTHDNGATGQGFFQYTAHIYEYDNNSPQFESPAIWWIMDGCHDQTYFITPQDPDGHTIRCRWSTVEEASFMAHDKPGYSSSQIDGNDWPMEQLTLDAVECSVTYLPDLDNHGGNKPIAVQVEDFDEDGNILSSVPCVFFGRVFTPDIDPAVLDNPFVGVNRMIAAQEDHHEDHHFENRTEPAAVSFAPRKQRTNEEYDHCDGLPVWVPPTPPNEHLFTYQATVEYYQVWAARFLLDGTYYTTVNRAQFSLPEGMSCTELRSDGTATCVWTPTVDQIGIHTICGLCYDVFKRPSARNCAKIEVIHKEPPVENPCETTEQEEMTRHTFSGKHIQSRMG